MRRRRLTKSANSIAKSANSSTKSANSSTKSDNSNFQPGPGSSAALWTTSVPF